MSIEKKSGDLNRKIENSIKLKGKFLITIGIALIIIIGISLIWTIHQEKKLVRYGSERTVKINGDLIKHSLEIFMADGLHDELSDFLNEIKTVDGIRDVRIFIDKSVQDNIERQVLSTGQKYSNYNSSKNIYREVIPFITNEGCLNCHDVKKGEVLGAASITIDQGEISKQANFNTKSLLGFGFVQVVIILTVLYLIIGTIILKPLEKLTSAAKRFSKGESDVVVDIKNKDELGVLANIFNTMIEKIGQQLDYLENIPTPITVINKDFTIQYINRVGAEFVGKGQSQCINQKCYNLFKMSHCQSEKCCTKKALKSGIECSDESIAFPGEMKMPVLYTAAPIKNKSGEQIGALESITDISGYKSLLNEVKAQEEYLAANTKRMLLEMEKFAKGDLRIELIPERKDEIGQLFTGFNNSIKNVAKILIHVKEAIIAGASAGAQISSSLEEMSAGAQQQNQQALEIAGAVEQMTKTILENAENATKASEASKQATERALSGENVMQQTQQGMGRIISSAQKTGEIISSFVQKTDQIDVITQLIEDIADQTNLLALNAAIEAARAGEHGRGFAVVADEVRSLAERTTQATKEISSTIQAIQTDAEQANLSKLETDSAIEEGLQLIEEIGKLFHDILKESDKVSDIVTLVATATEEQSTTSEQISKNISSISEVTRQTAIGIEQMAIAADSLSQLMEKLQTMIQKFKIDENGRFETVEFGEEDPETVAGAFEFVNN